MLGWEKNLQRPVVRQWCSLILHIANKLNFLLNMCLCIICINQSNTWLLQGSTYIQADWAQRLSVLREVLNLLTKIWPIKCGKGSARIHLWRAPHALYVSMTKAEQDAAHFSLYWLIFSEFTKIFCLNASQGQIFMLWPCTCWLPTLLSHL